MADNPEAVSGDYEQEDAVVHEVLGAVCQEGLLDPLLFLVEIVGRVQVQDAERFVGHLGLKYVGSQEIAGLVVSVLCPFGSSSTP